MSGKNNPIRATQEMSEKNEKWVGKVEPELYKIDTLFN